MTRRELMELQKAKHVQNVMRGRFDAEDDGQWITTENGHHVHLNEEGTPDKGNPHVISKMTGEKTGYVRNSPKESKRALQKISDSSGWWGRRSDLEEELEDEGFSVLESNSEYMVVDDDQSESDTQFELRLGGTEHTVTINEINTIRMPDSGDEDWDDEDDEEEDG